MRRLRQNRAGARGRKGRTAVALGLAALMIPLAAQPADLAGDDPAYRYLFVIDSSPAMARMTATTRNAVYDLIASGMHGRIQPGDVVVVDDLMRAIERAAVRS